MRIGCVKYVNARPLIHGWKGEVMLDVPAMLCRQLAEGNLDVALVSSIEYLRNPIYRIVDQIAIASDGPAYSVVVAYEGELSNINHILLDPASETSVVLLRYVLAKRGLNPRLLEDGAPVTPGPMKAHCSMARLLIGDQAIQFRQSNPDCRFWDLGGEWNARLGLPFVYALWLVRPEVPDARSIAEQLRSLRDENLANIDKVIAHVKTFDPEFCRRYYREHLRFTFGDLEKKGLQAFSRVCAELDLIPRRELQFDLI